MRDEAHVGRSGKAAIIGGVESMGFRPGWSQRRLTMGWMRRYLAAVAAIGLGGLAGCGGSSGTTTPPPLSVTLGSSTVILPQDGTPVTIPVTITGTDQAPTVSVLYLPSGVFEQYTILGSGPS